MAPKVVRPRLRMKDLCARSGLPRQAVHFYIQQGLVPQGHKTGRNTAYYGEEHLARLALVRRLQHERFLPLKAIKAILDEQEGTFSPAQRRLLHEVKAQASPDLAGVETPESLTLAEARRETGIGRDDLDGLVAAGLVATAERPRSGARPGGARIARRDLWLLRGWVALRAAGFSAALGFTPEDLLPLEAAVAAVFQWETRLVRDRLAGLDPRRLSAMVERGVPLLGDMLMRFHEAKTKNFFGALDGSSKPGAAARGGGPKAKPRGGRHGKAG